MRLAGGLKLIKGKPCGGGGIDSL